MNTIYIPIGTGCGIAQELKRRNLRTVALPFDWVYTWSLDVINLMIKDKFKALFVKDNWILSDQQKDMEEKDELRYLNKKYDGFYSIHDFKKSGDFEKDYPKYCVTMNRRVSRFFEALNGNEKIIFIRDDHHLPIITKYNNVEVFKQNWIEFNQFIQSVNSKLEYDIIYITEYINENEISNFKEKNLHFWYVHSNNLTDDWRRLVIPWDAIFHNISLLR